MNVARASSVQGGGKAELIALQRIDEMVVRLQEEGRYEEAFAAMERGLVLRQHLFGSDSDEVWAACSTVAEMANMLAMDALQVCVERGSACAMCCLLTWMGADCGARCPTGYFGVCVMFIA